MLKRLLPFVIVALLLLPASAARAGETPKILGQVSPSATTLTTLYTVPSSTNTIVSTVVIANRNNSSATFRVTAQLACAAVSDEMYLAYDATVPANDSIVMTLGITLAATDCIRVYSSTTTLSFNAFGSEVTP